MTAAEPAAPPGVRSQVWCTWSPAAGERAMVVRRLAGALSRLGPVLVVDPTGPPGDGPRIEADGLFDVHRWPEGTPWPWADGPADLLLVDRPDPALVDRARARAPGAAVVLPVTDAPDGPPPPGIDGVLVVGAGAAAPGPPGVGLHVPVNPLVAGRRHNGLGFTGYVLVLEAGTAPAAGPPSAAVAWLAAGLARTDLVVVAQGTAAAYRGRALRGTIAVDTRTDLQRLMAHAAVTVDLAPGPLVARECVESLRLGTPVVVPAGSAAAPLAAQGGGLVFDGPATLLATVRTLSDPGAASAAVAGEGGRRFADSLYGDPHRFVARVGEAVAALRAAAPGTPLAPL